MKTLFKQSYDAQSYFNRIASIQASQRKRILSLYHSKNWTAQTSSILRRRGYLPKLILEKGILSRAKAHGLGKYVRKDLDTKVTHDFLKESVEHSRANYTKLRKFNGNFTKLVEATLRVEKSCKFSTKFRQKDLALTFSENVNKKASSGFPHFRKKGELRGSIIDEAFRLFSEPNHSNFHKYPMSVGFRTQLRNKFGEDDLKVKARVMYPITGAISLLEQSFAAPFIEHFQSVQTFYAMGHTGREMGDILNRNFRGKTNIISIDYTSYDMTVLNELIILAFWILRNNLNITMIQEEYTFDKILIYFMNSIIGYKVGRDQVQFYIKEKGIPSGSAFTNLIGTLVNAIILEYIQPGATMDNAQICSDDNIFVSQYTLKHVTSRMRKYFGLNVERHKCDVFSDSKTLDFLGYRWIDFQRNIDPILVVNQCVWHTSFREKLSRYERELGRCASVLLNGRNGIALFKRMFPDVINALRLKRDIKFLFMRDNAPPLRLPSLSSQPLKGEDVYQSLRLHLIKGYDIR
jgi:hypothetical protein